MKAAGWGHVQQAVKYDAWASSRRHDSAQARGASLASNDWHQRQNASIAAAQKRCWPRESGQSNDGAVQCARLKALNLSCTNPAAARWHIRVAMQSIRSGQLLLQGLLSL